MDFEQELARVARAYSVQGFDILIRPSPEFLPPFAKDFAIEILGKRWSGGVLVSVKEDRGEVAADLNLTRYAEITSQQPEWRFDLAILEEEKHSSKEIDEAEDFSAFDVEKAFGQATELAPDFPRPALITAWAGFEAAMRLRLRAAGEEARWGTVPRSMLNELYSSGSLDAAEFRKLETLFRVRNQIAHGFLSDLASEGGAVGFLCETGRRLIAESQKESETVSSA